ncbi:NhaP-type Na+/H+ or K+/H+ antiporter [Anaerosolibacter carboniphilus]|uniref:NhaP-type Na+/H+ or K+/H+ antiporter n=1 Tax=Anaerosolibacter carboniphilus TaxID=1417629 RepID=A0A841KQ62_9FIRM|nr:sodium:proton antiporter [Anaerosolibacter carboniphilus]MBB6215616.1 NhaP-type Na+/H+ or K+/H+ antiporter [Anaerosolibacter carboniphilus]
MENASMIATDEILTLIVIILIIGMIFGKLSKIVKLPDVVMFLLAGIIIGPAILNWASVEGYPIGNQLILTFGSAFILYDGGREIKLRVLNDVKVSVGLLSSLGVLISAFIVGYAAMWIFHIPFIYALLLGAVVASTDPATLVPVFKEITLKDKVKQTVISESAFNDAVGAIMVFSILAIIQSGTFSLMDNLGQLVQMALGGILVGAAIGMSLSVLISDTKYGIMHDYASIISIVSVVIAFIFAEKIGGSGYMATFTTGLVCGNKKRLRLWVPEEDFITQTHVRETLAFVMRMAIFILLGTHVNFHVLGKYWMSALIVVIVLMFVARPLSVLACVLPDRKGKWTFNEIGFLMWVRETGVIPAALSGMIVSMKIPHSDVISSVVFMTVLITLGVQASTTKFVARKLNLLENKEEF